MKYFREACIIFLFNLNVMSFFFPNVSLNNSKWNCPHGHIVPWENYDRFTQILPGYYKLNTKPTSTENPQLEKGPNMSSYLPNLDGTTRAIAHIFLFYFLTFSCDNLGSDLLLFVTVSGHTCFDRYLISI